MGFFCADNLSRHAGVVHGFFDRHGGMSPAPFDSLNVGTAVGDAPACVSNNRKRVALACEREPASLVFAEQVHAADVADISEVPLEPPRVDVLVTTEPRLTLALYTADCVPLLLVAGHVVGAAHAGWKGTALEVARHAAQAVATKAQVSSGQVTVALGPAIGPCCFEVSRETADPLRRVAGGRGLSRETATRAHVDLWALNEAVLRAAGVTDIEVHRLCTMCSPEYFSHRRDRGRTGRQAALIGLR